MLADPNCQATLDQVLANRSAIFGIKYHPSVCQKRIVDPATVPFLEYCEREGMLVLVHNGREVISHSSFVFRVAPVYSRTKFVFAHLGANASDLVEATLTDVQTNYRDIDNVYLDTSTAKMPYLVASAVELMGSERIVFGSDVPYADFRISRYCVDLAEIAEEEKAGRSRLT